MEHLPTMHKVVAVAVLLATGSFILWSTAAPRQDASVHFVRVQSSRFASVTPAQLRGTPYNVSIGCWHIREDSRGAQSLHVVAEANFEPGERWQEVSNAVFRTHNSNPGVHYILVTKQLSMLELASTSLADIPHDIWYCPEVLYGTPIHISNLYNGPKFTMSIDNWLPPVTWSCNFTAGTQSVVYIIQRSESMELSGQDNSCTVYRNMGSADGLLFDTIPTELLEYLRFPRTYWGCENLAMFVLQRAGIKLVNLCPYFAPVHAHMSGGRDPGRLRINQMYNSVGQGEDADMQTLCRDRNSTSL